MPIFPPENPPPKKRKKKVSTERNFPKSIEENLSKIDQRKFSKIDCSKSIEKSQTAKTPEFCASNTMKMAFFFLGGPGVGRSDGRKINRLKEIFPKSIEDLFSKIDQRTFSKIDCSKSIEKAQPAKKKIARVLCFKHYEKCPFFPWKIPPPKKKTDRS